MKVFCHQCGRHTNHTLIAKQSTGSEVGDDYQWGDTHYLVRCDGCDAITYAIESWSEDDWDPQTGKMESTWSTYPKGETERHAMKEVFQLPAKVRIIYEEVVGAMNERLPVLSGVGLRALIEAICKEQEIAGGTLEKLIDGLATNGVLSQAQADILHTHRFLGNVAAHETVSAQPRELVAALEIAETVLRTIYVLPNLSKEVKTGRKQ